MSNIHGKCLNLLNNSTAQNETLWNWSMKLQLYQMFRMQESVTRKSWALKGGQLHAQTITTDGAYKQRPTLYMRSPLKPGWR